MFIQAAFSSLYLLYNYLLYKQNVFRNLTSPIFTRYLQVTQKRFAFQERYHGYHFQCQKLGVAQMGNDETSLHE